ncbi:probable serine/threonine-protein kinase kinX [Drosophila tropicalis]|uniref:probable serine/threonine-protein kinase kinX n=1 Tax=Drosophila tropicalis TaxID=46794 RepID=UPI0035AB9A75
METLDDPEQSVIEQELHNDCEDTVDITMPSSEDIWQSYLDVKEGRINQTEANWPISLMCNQSSDQKLEGKRIFLKKRLPQLKAPVFDYNEGNLAANELLKWQTNNRNRTASESSEDEDPSQDEMIDTENVVETNNIVEEDADLKEWIQSELLNEPLSDIEEFDMLLTMANDNSNYETLYKVLKPKVIVPAGKSPEPTEDDDEDNSQETSCTSEESKSEEESSPEMRELNEEKLEEIPIEEASQEDPVKEYIEEPLEEHIEEPIMGSIKQTIEDPIEQPIKEPIKEAIIEPIMEPVKEPMREPIKEPDLIEESIKESVEEIAKVTANETSPKDIHAKVEMPKAKHTQIESIPQVEVSQEPVEDEMDFASLIDFISEKVVPEDAIKSTLKQLESELMLYNEDNKELENQMELELPELPLILDIQDLAMLPPKPMDETAHQEWLQECSQKITEQLQQIAFSVAGATPKQPEPAVAKPQGIDYEMEISKEQLKPCISVSPKRPVSHTGWQNKFIEMLDDFEDDVIHNMTEFRDPQAKRLRSKWYAQCSKTVEDLRRTLVLPALPHPLNERLQKIRILRRPPKRQEPFHMSIEMKYVRTFCTLQTNRQMELMSLLSVLDNSIYCPEIDVLQKRSEATQLAWLWRDGTVMIINGRSENMLAETQKDLMSKILGVNKNLSPEYCHNVTYLRLTFHAQFPWKIDLIEFNRALILSPEPIQRTDCRYAYYVNKTLPGVAARVFESGAIAVYAMSPAEADQMFECLYMTTNKYRKTEMPYLSNESLR